MDEIEKKLYVIVKENVKKCSDSIFNMKEEAKLGKFGYISPKSLTWPVYSGYKRECSIWLTAIRQLKGHPFKETIHGPYGWEACKRLDYIEDHKLSKEIK